jgi:hypothetical protein
LNFFSISPRPQTSMPKKNRTNRAAKSPSAPKSQIDVLAGKTVLED